jgi:hypothetical protein
MDGVSTDPGRRKILAALEASSEATLKESRISRKSSFVNGPASSNGA